MGTQHLDLELLRTFVAIVDNGSINRALGQINKTQSTVSLQIKRLEDQLNSQLFIRKARKLELTADGKRFVSFARRMLVIHDDTVNAFTQNQDELNLTIGCPDDYTQVVMPHLLSILQANKKITVTLISKNSGELRALLDDGQLDLAVLTRPPESEEGHLIYQDYGVWVFSDPEIFKQKPIPLALFEPTCKFHSSIVDSFEKKDIDHHILCQASNIEFLLNMASKQKAACVVAHKAYLNSSYKENTNLQCAETVSELGAFPLPVVEVALVSKAANQQVMGISIHELAKQLGDVIN